MIEVLRSSVNTWECDMMGHLNVRYYFVRAREGLALLALTLGLTPSKLRAGGLTLSALDQHVRFHREMRPGTAYGVSAGVLEASTDSLRVYEEIRLVGKPNEVATTITSDVVLVDAATQRRLPWPADALARAHALALATELPEYGAPRGIAREASRTPPLHEEARTRGLIGAYLGPVVVDDCDAHGVMLESAFMARVSDGVPHFFYAIRDGERPSGAGGAALEYRFVFHERPRLGDIIEMRTGLVDVGRKAMRFCHFIFNLETGRCAAASEAVAVSFDLKARKAIEIDPDTRALLQAHVIPDLHL
jgi:acyl-CoA thioester hydrolase